MSEVHVLCLLMALTDVPRRVTFTELVILTVSLLACIQFGRAYSFAASCYAEAAGAVSSPNQHTCYHTLMGLPTIIACRCYIVIVQTTVLPTTPHEVVMTVTLQRR